MAFTDNLALLPPVKEGTVATFIHPRTGETFTLAHRPGQAGSLAVYLALIKLYGHINDQAARMGLVWYAEHTDDARLHPGKHPNIDRLFRLLGTDDTYQLRD